MSVRSEHADIQCQTVEHKRTVCVRASSSGKKRTFGTLSAQSFTVSSVSSEPMHFAPPSANILIAHVSTTTSVPRVKSALTNTPRGLAGTRQTKPSTAPGTRILIPNVLPAKLVIVGRLVDWANSSPRIGTGPPLLERGSLTEPTASPSAAPSAVAQCC